MLSGILFVFILILGIHWTIAVNMCTNQSSSGRDVSLTLVPGTDVSGCNCSVKLFKTENCCSVKPKMSFEVVKFSGCKYRLVITNDNTKNIISCSNNNSVFFNINTSDETKLYLESNVPSQDETTTFEMKITSSNERPLILLECFLPTVKSTTNSVITTLNITVVPQTTPTTVTTQRRTTKSVQPQPTSTTVTTQRSTTKPVQPQPTSTTVTKTSSSKTGSTRRDADDADGCNDNNNDVIAGVIGAVIGGVIVGVSILIIMWIFGYENCDINISVSLSILKYRKRSRNHHLNQLSVSHYIDLPTMEQNDNNN